MKFNYKLASNRFTFDANALKVIVGIIGFFILIILSLWQYGRVQEKEQLQTFYISNQAKVPVSLTELEQVPQPLFYPVTVTGHFMNDKTVLLESSQNNIKGYQVLTPIILKEAGIMLVNRGWVPASNAQNPLPLLQPIEGEQTIVGFWRPLPQKSFQLNINTPPQFPLVRQQIDIDELKKIYGANFQTEQLLLRNDQRYGFKRDWQPDLKPAKNVGYALQWLFLAIGWFLVFILIHSRKQN